MGIMAGGALAVSEMQAQSLLTPRVPSEALHPSRCLGRLRNFPQAHSQDSEDLGSTQDNSCFFAVFSFSRGLPSVLQSLQESRVVLTMFSSWLPSSSSLPSRSNSFSLISCQEDRKCTVRLGGWCKGQRASFLRAEPGDHTVRVWQWLCVQR